MKWLGLTGEIDGAVFMACASWAAFDPAHVKLALLVGGLAGALGIGLKAVAKAIGAPDPVPQIPNPGAK